MTIRGLWLQTPTVGSHTSRHSRIFLVPRDAQPAHVEVANSAVFEGNGVPVPRENQPGTAPTLKADQRSARGRGADCSGNPRVSTQPPRSDPWSHFTEVSGFQPCALAADPRTEGSFPADSSKCDQGSGLLAEADGTREQHRVETRPDQALAKIEERPLRKLDFRLGNLQPPKYQEPCLVHEDPTDGLFVGDPCVGLQ